jgi:hypothetical protein
MNWPEPKPGKPKWEKVSFEQMLRHIKEDKCQPNDVTVSEDEESLRKQLAAARVEAEIALAEFRRYSTPYYDRSWAEAVEKVKRLEDKILKREARLPIILEGLVAFLIANGNPPPTLSFRIVEIRSDASVDHRGRICVKRSEFVEPTQYEQRFDELLKIGLSWINVCCYGRDGDQLIIGIEVPKGTPIQVTPTSVNYSGPSDAVLGNNWRADEMLVIE